MLALRKNLHALERCVNDDPVSRRLCPLFSVPIRCLSVSSLYRVEVAHEGSLIGLLFQGAGSPQRALTGFESEYIVDSVKKRAGGTDLRVSDDVMNVMASGAAALAPEGYIFAYSLVTFESRACAYNDHIMWRALAPSGAG
jgi:hypothetical protein